MKIIMLIGKGANQKALANRMHATVPLAAVALVDIPKKGKGPRLTTRITSASVGLPLKNAWNKLFQHYDHLYRELPPVPTSVHEGVNSLSVMSLVENIQPDLVVVSGTDLLREPLISKAKIINLHTGISPHIKGGPNCTNWALAIGEFGLIGNTIMWLDAGIDSGNLIATERTPLTGRESLYDLHLKVMDHAHDMCCRCVKLYVDGIELNSVPQAELGSGRLFLTKHWTAKTIAAAVFNFYTGFSPERIGRDHPQLVPAVK
jgi:hypothetical protein